MILKIRIWAFPEAKTGAGRAQAFRSSNGIPLEQSLTQKPAYANIFCYKPINPKNSH